MKLSNPIIMNNEDVSFQTDDKRRFRLRAAGIIIENGCVLFATNASEKYYYSIGGGVMLGEDAQSAVVREVFEETGIHYDVDRLVFVHENFFKRDDGMMKGLSCHEITFYFLMKTKGNQELNSNSISHGFKEEMVWIPIEELNKYEAYPRFFAQKLKNLPQTPEHILTIQN